MKAAAAMLLASMATSSLACTPEIVRTRAVLAPSSDGAPLVIGRELRVRGITGWSEVLPAGSTWRHIGRIGQGDVYERTGGVFMLTGRNTHEASLVVSGGKLVGFYLPGESNYAPASEAVALSPP